MIKIKMNKQKMLYSGKTKSLYETDQKNILVAEFRDDTTAFNGVKHEKLKDKGMVNNHINAYLMEVLSNAGVPTAFETLLSNNESIIKHLKMIPIENIIRNIAAGSLCKRLGVQSGTKLRPALYELFLKSDALGDPLINENHALAFNWASLEELTQMKLLTFQINEVLSSIFSKAGLILVDAKFEFGKGADGKIYLGDEISPDSCRIWDMDTHEPLDKDRFRQDLGEVVSSYQRIAQRLGIEL